MYITCRHSIEFLKYSFEIVSLEAYAIVLDVQDELVLRLADVD